MHDYALILTLAAGFSIALVLGYVTQRLGLSPILGYLVAGFVVGPHTPGFVADAALATQLAEVGVILLMFGVGLHFRWKDLLAVKWIAIPGAVGQSLVATALGAAVALASGWPLGAGVVLGIAISVASTVVLMRVLEDNNALHAAPGHIAVGWLIVEDLLTVLALVLLPAVAEATSAGSSAVAPGPLDGAAGGAAALGPGVLASLAWAALRLGALLGIMVVVGARLVPWILTQVARSRSRELFTLAVLASALAIATASAILFGASMALGAFLAGMIVGQSETSHQAAADALPMRDAFAVLFFLSVGMLFDPAVVTSEPALLAAVLAIILVAKPLAAAAIVLVLGYSLRSALTVALGLAQIGEFSFIVADAARKLDVIPEKARSVLVAGALLSIALNPLLFRAAPRIEAALRARPRLWSLLHRRAEAAGAEATREAEASLSGAEATVRAIVVGHGPVGGTVSELLRDFGIEPVIVELNVDTVKRLSSEGRRAIYGDAGRREVLEAAGIAGAAYVIVTLPDPTARASVIATVRALKPGIAILVRARYLSERTELRSQGATAVCFEEAEAAVGLAKLLLLEVGAPPERIQAEADRIRAKFALPVLLLGRP